MAKLPPKSPYQGACPAPFLQESLFPPRGGCMYTSFNYLILFFLVHRPNYHLTTSCGRPALQQQIYRDIVLSTMPSSHMEIFTRYERLTLFVSSNSIVGHAIAHWVYCLLEFLRKTEVANWLAIAAFITNALLLVSYAVLPVKVTHRHYLNVCLILGIMSFQVCAPDHTYVVFGLGHPDSAFRWASLYLSDQNRSYATMKLHLTTCFQSSLALGPVLSSCSVPGQV